MPVYQLTPNGDITASRYNCSRTGTSPSDWRALTDNDNATFVELLADPALYSGIASFCCDLTTYTVPATEVIRAVRVAFRLSASTSPDLYTVFEDSSGQQCSQYDYWYGLGTRFDYDVTGQWITKAPDGGPWTQAKIDDLRIRWGDNMGALSAHYVNIHEAHVELLTVTIPTVTPTGPNGPYGGTSPTFTWSHTNPDGTRQEQFRVKVFRAADARAVGFDPNTAVPVLDSGVVFNGLGVWQVPADTPLQTGHAYRAFISVTDEGSGGVWSSITASGPYATVSLNVESPAIPSLLAVGGSGPARVALSIESADNLLGKVPVAHAVSSCIVTSVTGSGPSNSGAFTRVTATADGDFTVSFDDHTAHVSAGQKVCAAIALRTVASAPRSWTIAIKFYDASNTLLSTATSGSWGEISGGIWSQLFIQDVTVPANAVTAGVFVTCTGAPSGSQHDLDAALLAPRQLYNYAWNPLGTRDYDDDGIADSLTLVNTGSGPDPVGSYDGSEVVIGDRTPKFTIGANTGTKGWSQQVTMRETQPQQVSIWVRASKSANFQITCDQITAATSVTLQANVWTLVQLSTSAANPAGVTGASTVKFFTTTADLTLLWTLAQFVVPVSDYDPSSNFLADGWSRGGLAGAVTYVLERSVDFVNWTPVRQPVVPVWLPGTKQTISATDYEVPEGTTSLFYRARARFSDGTFLLSSPTSFTVQPSGLPVSANGNWAVSLTDPSFSAFLDVQAPLKRTKTERTAVKRPLGRTTAIVLHGTRGGLDGSMVVHCQSSAEYDALVALKDRQETVLMQWFDGRHQYIDFVGDLGEERTTDTYHVVDVGYVETSRPE